MGISDDIGVEIIVEEFNADGIIKIERIVSLKGLALDKRVITEFTLGS